MPKRPKGVFNGCDIAIQRDRRKRAIYPLGVYDGDMTDVDHTQHQAPAGHDGHGGHTDTVTTVTTSRRSGACSG